MSQLVCALPRKNEAPTIVWSPEFHKLFLELCMEQTLAGNRSGRDFNENGWSAIIVSFEKKTDTRCDKTQLLNRWQTIRKQWKTWRKLIGCEYMKWDPETNSLGASNDDWVNYLVENPNAAEFRSGPPSDFETLEVIFADDNLDDVDVEVQATSKRLVRRRDDVSDIEEDENGLILSRSSGYRTKSFWTPELHALFVELLLHEAVSGDKPGISRQGWKNILDSFNERSGVGYTRFHLKNHWDSTRKQWKMWSKLICTSCMKWDPDTGTFGASDKDWESYIHANEKAAPFRHRPIAHADKLEVIFGGLLLSGDTDDPPPPPPSALRRRKHKRRSYSALYADDSPMSVSPLYVYEPPRGSSGRRPVGRPRKRQNGQYSPTNIQVDESRSYALAYKSPEAIAEAEPDYSIGECIKCLDGMEEVEAGSDLYLFALDMFLKKEYREIFLQLKTPSLRVGWLQRLQMFGPCPN